MYMFVQNFFLNEDIEHNIDLILLWTKSIHRYIYKK